jgi:dolichol-phosphate mannosyltransferase
MVDTATKRIPELSIVIPLFNEEDNLAELHRRLMDTLAPLGISYELLLVNDGSRDSTPRLLDDLAQSDEHITVIHLSRNFGHQPAVCAGLDHARGSIVMIMDGDLQDPPEVIPQFIERWRDGYDVVYAVREKRKEGPLKRLGYFTFYRLLNLISDLRIPLDSGDFCLLDRCVVDALQSLPEKKRFVRGLRTFVGFRQTGLAYERAAREAGEPKYTLRSLLGLAIDGLISFSSYPLRLVTYCGLLSAVFALLMTIWVLYDAYASQSAPRGWASTIVVILFMGSVQLLSLGIVGEYVRLIFQESKGRPTYIVREIRSAAVASRRTMLEASALTLFRRSSR